eukprot:gnl/TRDRNA2_/TRDRNA2_193995_c0_seq1.p1 gnl/TRDRNA2_/TRDRNA2_193995_c0~~gnl/TRDRNA2_/TRDRNA2_193995_c0_seq1.p1  ORF type:complete len:192 (-),score=33.86 gnl/TRDRNA2_/TRDRNA2_193995_c0_seq1:59-565(-)
MAPADEIYQPRTVVSRDLDGFLFTALVLRVDSTCQEADVAYVDDGNIERGVPFDELSEAPEEERAWNDMLEQKWLEAQALLMADDAETCADSSSRPSTAMMANMRWEQGRYVNEDGSVTLSSPAGALGEDFPKEPAKTQAEGPCARGGGLRGIRHLRKHRQAPACAAA